MRLFRKKYQFLICNISLQPNKFPKKQPNFLFDRMHLIDYYSYSKIVFCVFQRNNWYFVDFYLFLNINYNEKLFLVFH